MQELVHALSSTPPPAKTNQSIAIRHYRRRDKQLIIISLYAAECVKHISTRYPALLAVAVNSLRV